MSLTQIQKLSDDIMNCAKKILDAQVYDHLIYIANMGITKRIHRLTAEFMFINIIERTNLPEAMFLAQQAKEFFILVENYNDNQRAESYLTEMLIQSHMYPELFVTALPFTGEST